MFVPNNYGYWLRKNDRRSITGRETFEPQRRIPLSVVTLKEDAVRTTVRADSSASRGAAEQLVHDAKVLIPILYSVKIGDVLKVRGLALTISGIHKRYDVFGVHDHNEIHAHIRSDQ